MPETPLAIRREKLALEAAEKLNQFAQAGATSKKSRAARTLAGFITFKGAKASPPGDVPLSLTSSVLTSYL